MSIPRLTRRRESVAAILMFAVCCTVQALEFELPVGSGESIEAVLNTSVTVGGGVRMQDRSSDLIGKSNLNPDLCVGPNGANQFCQGLFKDQLHPAQVLVAAPGSASLNNDDGNLNYDKGDLISGLAKVSTDLTLNWGDWGLFVRGLYFYDAVNNDFREYHPNRITDENYLQVGRQTSALPLGLPTDPGAILSDPYALFTGLIAGRPWGQPGPNGTRISYGPGGVVRNKRSDSEVLREVGTDLQLLDVVLYGRIPLGAETDVAVKLGRQTVGWGESTTLVLNSINQINPVNANNNFRIGKTVEEVFTPINMLFLSFQPFADATVEFVYPLEWRNVESAAPGSYFSDLDLGTNNAIDTVNISAGGVAEDPDRRASPLDSPLSGLTNTTSTVRRLRDSEPSAGGEVGLAFKYYAEGLGNGVEFGAYFMKYHSRLPYASFYATNASCARSEGNDLGIDATDLLSFLAACPDIPFVHSLTHPGEDATFATDSAAPFDSARLQFVYPENIQLFGVSFNAAVGDYSIQGEVAYRPNQPLQVDVQDVAYAAFAPSLTRCHDRSVGCLGSAGLLNQGIGFGPDGNATNYGSSDFTDADGNSPYPDLVNVGIGHVPGSARAFPSFVTAYRGGAVGETTPCAAGMSDAEYRPGIDCYVRGYERFPTYQFNLGTTRIFGINENPLGADQIIWVTEWGATWVPTLPALDRLQIEAPGTEYHASAGADGSGADGSRQACSLNPACTVGPDGLRSNPHQQDLGGFVDKFSWGYRFIGIFSYESVFPSISLRPVITWAHDVAGTAPGPATNFVKGRKQADILIETRYRDFLSISVGYTWFTGGGAYNLLRDRDYAQVFARYQF